MCSVCAPSTLRVCSVCAPCMLRRVSTSTHTYQPRRGDAVWSVPNPGTFGFMFSRAVDPSGRTLPAAVLRRDGLVWLLGRAPAGGPYFTDVEVRGSCAVDALRASGASRATGVPEHVFLSECNARWRAWASTRIADPSNAGSPAYGGPVFTAGDVAHKSLDAAAVAWGWERA